MKPFICNVFFSFISFRKYFIKSLSIIIGIAIYSCTTNDMLNSNKSISKLQLIKNNETEFLAHFKSGNYVFTLEASGKALINSKLKITDINSVNESSAEINFQTNLNAPAFRLVQHKKVIDEAKKSFVALNKLKIHDIIKSFDDFENTLFSDTRINSRSTLVHSIYFHNAIINTVGRSKDKIEDCGCTPHPGYFIEKIGFWCQEDFLISPSEFIKVLDKGGYQLSELEKAPYSFLQKNKSEEFISVDKFFNVVESKSAFLARVDRIYQVEMNNIARISDDGDRAWFDCMRGYDWGCCGNYAGCCWVFSMYCYVHDRMCINCTPRRFCFSGCVPG